MTSEEIEKINKLVQRQTEGLDSSVYMSGGWMFFCGEVQGIVETMIVLGYEWNGSKFVEVSHD